MHATKYINKYMFACVVIFLLPYFWSCVSKVLTLKVMFLCMWWECILLLASGDYHFEHSFWTSKWLGNFQEGQKYNSEMNRVRVYNDLECKAFTACKKNHQKQKIIFLHIKIQYIVYTTIIQISYRHNRCFMPTKSQFKCFALACHNS